MPGVIRDLTPAEVIEAMLVENVNRSDLTTSEEVKAIERLMDLSAGKLTPARLCKRIGRSQGWVRTRMAICALSAEWREAIDRGDLSLAAGEAAAWRRALASFLTNLVCAANFALWNARAHFGQANDPHRRLGLQPSSLSASPS